MRYDLVLFDLDGTLVDTAPDIADALNRVLELRKLPELPEAWVRSRIGHGARPLLAQAHATATRQVAGAEQPAPLPALAEEFARHYADCCGRRGRAYPGAAAALAALRGAGVRLALLTNKERRFARVVLDRHGLDGAFDLELFGDSLPARKPDPLPVRHALSALGVPAARALLVGDSALDVRAARNAGIAAWAVSYGYGDRQELAAARPDRTIGSLRQVTAASRSYAPRASSSSLY
ncbi:MAG: HAD-IA family hydrolase, partial [Nevskiaceae bacterium]